MPSFYGEINEDNQKEIENKCKVIIYLVEFSFLTQEE